METDQEVQDGICGDWEVVGGMWEYFSVPFVDPTPTTHIMTHPPPAT